jgi:hypothetical protein
VPESVVASIIGHDVPTMTFGLYSGGVSLAVKREALAKAVGNVRNNGPELLEAAQ